ncbi:hypothetical protein [Bradyrhizobium iriomotense]|uniref:DUF748 domain-containing protein n=1 Tax=Bradyrhizobium iriomotense TaxID=441950 RepID=A0ABQ6BIU7_9BRAD|nr:hypothetical protein [Bradyrhizobium iriomotense]GLR92048.1 hypothetical protein GCM10007857_87670 [Bradyrhizobium iriomotense]
MRRILIGLIALAVLAGGGWLGFNLYVQHRATAEVEAAFDQIRSRGGKASHGKVAFDLMTRTLTVEDIAVDPGQPPLAGVKVASVKAVGVRQSDEARFSADTIDVAGLELTLDGAAGPSKVKAAYRVPQITVTDYSGPARAQGTPASTSLVDAYRFALEQYASIAAASVTVPTVTVTMDTGSSAAGSGEVTYSGLAIRNINRGKVDKAKIDHAVFSFSAPHAAKPDKLTGELSDMIIEDADVNAVIAALDPDKANDDSYHRAYRQISTGPYVLTSTQGVRAQIDGITIEDLGFQPSKFRPADFLALLPKDPSAPQSPAQAREMMEKVAAMYEGMRVGKAEIRNLSIGTPQGTAKLNAIRYAQGELALEGLDAPAPQGQFKMERFSLKSFSVASLMRWAAGLTAPGRAPSPDQMLGLFGVLAGAEIKGVVAPFKTTKKLVTIDTLSLDWGQMVGSIPSKAHVVAKFVTPTDPSDPKQLPFDKLAIDLDLGAAWTESSNSFALTPATLDIGGIAKAQLRITLSNVPRELFSSDPAQFMGQAAQVEAVALEFSVRDNGFVDSAVTQNARGRNVSRDEARRTLVDSVRVYRADVAAANPEAGTAADAIASFIETPGQTLVIKITPRAKVPLMQLMQLFNADPEGTLAQFNIEASTGL